MRREVFEGLLLSLVRVYKFQHNNEAPAKIIIPKIASINGIPVEYAELIPVAVVMPAGTISQDAIKKAKEMLNANAS